MTSDRLALAYGLSAVLLSPTAATAFKLAFVIPASCCSSSVQRPFHGRSR